MSSEEIVIASNWNVRKNSIIEFRKLVDKVTSADVTDKNLYFPETYLTDVLFGYIVGKSIPCVDVRIPVMEMYNFLKKIELASGEDWDTSYRPKVSLIDYVADAADLTEHGSSVGGAWLSSEGEAYIAIVDHLIKIGYLDISDLPSI